MERAQRGDRDAFSSLAIELSDQLFGVAHRILRDFDSASDAFQVALVRIWRDLPGLRDPDLLETWSYRVLINACNDELRRARRFKPEIRGVGLEHLPVADAYASVVDRESLERAFPSSLSTSGQPSCSSTIASSPCPRSRSHWVCPSARCGRACTTPDRRCVQLLRRMTVPRR